MATSLRLHPSTLNPLTLNDNHSLAGPRLPASCSPASVTRSPQFRLSFRCNASRIRGFGGQKTDHISQPLHLDHNNINNNDNSNNNDADADGSLVESSNFISNALLGSSLVSLLLLAPVSMPHALAEGASLDPVIVEAAASAPASLSTSDELEIAFETSAETTAVESIEVGATSDAEIDAAAAGSGSESEVKSDADASRVPEWFGTALLSFPLFAYVLFNIYRENFNPRATLLDFAFFLVAMFIVLNVVTTLTLGVRLY